MKCSSSNVAVAMLACSFALLFLSVRAAPMDTEDEQVDSSIVNSLSPHADEIDMSIQWDPINTAAIRKLLLQLDAEDRMVRGTRSWSPPETRGWGLRNIDGRLNRQWRADKRQVRFRQCYFNPISCFRK